MSNLYGIIKSLQNESGSNAKSTILEANKDNELLKEYLRATYDPAISYYIKKAPQPEHTGDEHLKVVNILGIVHMLNDRVLTGNKAVTWLKEEMQNFTKESQELISMMISRSVGAGVGMLTFEEIMSVFGKGVD